MQKMYDFDYHLLNNYKSKYYLTQKKGIFNFLGL